MKLNHDKIETLFCIYGVILCAACFHLFSSLALQPVLVITAGNQTTDQGIYTPLDIASSRLQSKGAAVFVLGIGKDVDTSQLTEIASEPNNVFTVDSFNDLTNKASETKRGICILGIVCSCILACIRVPLVSFAVVIAQCTTIYFCFCFFYFLSTSNPNTNDNISTIGAR